MAKCDIFISYKRSGTQLSSTFGLLLLQCLKKYGFEVFFDQNGLHGGADWQQRLEENLSAASDVIILLEEKSLISATTSALSEGNKRTQSDCDYRDDWFCKEIMRALELGKQIVPIKIDGYKMPAVDELPAEMQGLLDFQAIEWMGLHRMDVFVQSELIDQEEVLKCSPRTKTDIVRHGAGISQLLFHSEGASYDVYEYSELVANLSPEYTMDNPVLYTLDYAGRHHLRCYNLDSCETVYMDVDVEPYKQMFVEIPWPDRLCIWTLTEQQIRSIDDAGLLYSLGCLLYDGNRAHPADIQRSWWCLSRAIDLGSEHARTFIAGHGQGLINDKNAPRPVAICWYERSAEYGNMRAMVLLGNMYRKGKGVEQDYTAALKLLSKAAGMGDAVAMRFWGIMYRNGEGVEQDYTAALELFRKAADMGDAVAMRYLGIMYRDGTGVEKDFATGLYWMRKAVDMGDEGALNSLAWSCYLMGQYDEALLLAEKAVAARPKNSAAADTLATVYQSLHRYDEAMAQFERCLALYQEKNDEERVSRTLGKIDALRQLMGKVQ